MLRLILALILLTGCSDGREPSRTTTGLEFRLVIDILEGNLPPAELECEECEILAFDDPALGPQQVIVRKLPVVTLHSHDLVAIRAAEVFIPESRSRETGLRLFTSSEIWPELEELQREHGLALLVTVLDGKVIGRASLRSAREIGVGGVRSIAVAQKMADVLDVKIEVVPDGEGL